MAPVAYLGPVGTFSHLVARRRFRADGPLVACPSIGAIFDFLLGDPSALAVVPVENTSGGTIYDTVDLLIENAGALFVTEEIALDVRIALIGRSGAPVRRVFSHFVQLQHHREWLRANYPGVEVEAVSSTAVAAERAGAVKGGAALSAPGAAQLYGLDVLARPSLGGKVNVTHFLVLSHCKRHPAKPQDARTALAVSFSNECGSLYRFLEPFAKARVNINRIISRPFPGDADRAVFFMEIDGAPGVPAYDAVIERARKRSLTFAEFGSYPWRRRLRS
ncbi:MAG: prephenate dehydratase domain-containing protein [Terrimicrobiaceae bacterium]|nr:prephenate dehydratase domain-containing protein [Terrimicrobiaceae bacterium]